MPDASATRLTHTIAICTARDPSPLAVTLPQLFRSPSGATKTDLLVVDNRPASDPADLRTQIAALCTAEHIHFSVVHEPASGLSRARNLALRAAEGDILTFLDDDTAPRDGRWQSSILESFGMNPQVAIVGGPIHILLPASVNRTPPWRSLRVEQLFGCFGRNVADGFCPANYVTGGNASYRLAAVRSVPGLRFASGLLWSASRRSSLGGEEACSTGV